MGLDKKLRVVELFAGVGGFRLGLEKNGFDIVWSNQWEPSTKTQHASMVYEARFGSENHSNQDIETVPTVEIPDHDLLVGGFPCQDYSVATTLHNSKGLRGKKGVLWWSIHRILREKGHKKPKFLFLENVDRLLKSPANQRGRDFAVMLQSLNELGYAVEWRVINAAEYGMPQRRRRVFFLGYHKSTEVYKEIKKSNVNDWIGKGSLISKVFPIKEDYSLTNLNLPTDLVEITNSFNLAGRLSPFQNTGVMIGGSVYTGKTSPDFLGPFTTLGDVLENLKDVPEEFFITNSILKKTKTVYNKNGDEKIIRTEKEMWEYLKGAKKELRITKDGFEYNYSEGGMIFPDELDNASRTIITGEGGKSPSRFKHVIDTPKGLRRLTPVELERLNMFPKNHTKLDSITPTKRAFFMGNALVVGIVERIGNSIKAQLENEKEI